MRTVWYCEHCQTIDTVEHHSREGVMYVQGLINDSHRSKSPDCPQPVMELRVVNMKQIIANANLPGWVQAFVVQVLDMT